jgi:hypothetical protein
MTDMVKITLEVPVEEGKIMLPDGLSVGGYLDLRGTGITQLPDDAKVEGEIIR